ncbi:MAG: ribosome maturation factor RimP [Erysipelothrix sp.]|nr:ribosome maturation factor RimP [Erysipelothrix sp.]
MSNLNVVKQALEAVAKPYNIVVTNLLWRQDQGNRILEIPIMFNDGSMDLETCGLMSKYFIDALEDLEELDFEYFIDVCSPGAERVLETVADQKREIGQYVYVKFLNPKSGFHEIAGILSKVEEDHIVVEYMDKTRKKEFEIANDNINLIRLAVKI